MKVNLKNERSSKTSKLINLNTKYSLQQRLTSNNSTKKNPLVIMSKLICSGLPPYANNLAKRQIIV